MRILLCASAYHPHKGGVEEVVRQLARSYRQMGHRPIVVAPRWPRSLPASETVDGQFVLRLPMPMPSRHPRSTASFLLRFLPSAARALYIGTRWRPDLLHVHCVGPNGLYALILSHVLRVPLVVTSHGEQTMDATRLYERSAAQRWVLRRLLRRADAVTTCSTDALRNLAPYGPVPATAAPVPNGVDSAEFLHAALEPPHARPYIFAIGRHVWNKGFDVLLHAYAQLASDDPDLDLVVAGDGPQHQPLVGLASELGISDRVVFPGCTDRPATAAYFRHCRFFVLPSLHEPFGIVNLEAMAAGKAVIATRTGGVPEIVHDGQNGLLVPPGDADALAAAIASLLGNPEYAAALGEAGAQLVSEHYSWDKVAAAYLGVYDRARRRRYATREPHATIALEEH
jgi:glycogen synthase